MDKRIRVKRACDACRRRKRGCDEKNPCGPCVQSRIECSYSTTWTTHPARNNASRPSNGPTRASPTAVPRTQNEIIRTASRPTSSTSHQVAPIPAAAEEPPINFVDPKGLAGAGIISDDYPRFMRNTSAIAFPRLLGLALKAERPPRLHCYGYNLGLRDEEISINYGMIPVDAAAVRRYSLPFFSMPIEFVDQAWFMNKVDEYYRNPHPHLGTIIGGVFAIGSCLRDGHPLEREVVHWCKCCLEDASAVRKPSINAMIGFGLRAWYLRMTTRPNCAWLASCTVAHMMESTGLHREENLARLSEFSALSIEKLRQVFWSIYAMHNIISYEYGRTFVTLDITTKRYPSVFLELITSNSLEALHKIQVTHPFLIFTKTDVALSIWRRHWQSKTEFNESILLDFGDVALENAESLCSDPMSTLYFNTLVACFQFACTLLALRTPPALARVERAFAILGQLADRINTKMAREALATANTLLGAVIDERRGELSGLDAIYSRGIETPTSDITEAILDFDWTLLDGNFEPGF